MSITIIENIGATGSDLYASEEGWIACIGTTEIRLGIYAEVMDMLEVTGDEQFEGSARFYVEFGIMPHHPSDQCPALDADTMAWIESVAGENLEVRDELKREAVKKYGLTVGCGRQLRGVTTPGVDLPIPKHSMRTTPYGIGWTFEDELDAQNYARAVIEQRAGAVMILIGYVLDAQINPMGETGWDWLRMMDPSLASPAGVDPNTVTVSEGAGGL